MLFMNATMNLEADGCAPSTESPVAKTVKVLCVDDQPSNLLALEATLDDLGLELVKASSGQDALRCILRDDFALILMDVRMPNMDGFETAEFIRQRERSKDTPIIFITASERDEPEIFKGYSLGAVDYLCKPIQPSTALQGCRFRGHPPEDVADQGTGRIGAAHGAT